VPLSPERIVASGGARFAGVDQPQMTTGNASGSGVDVPTRLGGGPNPPVS
jgi:hypothetical protein